MPKAAVKKKKKKRKNYMFNFQVPGFYDIFDNLPYLLIGKVTEDDNLFCLMSHEIFMGYSSIIVKNKLIKQI